MDQRNQLILTQHHLHLKVKNISPSIFYLSYQTSMRIIFSFFNIILHILFISQHILDGFFIMIPAFLHTRYIYSKKHSIFQRIPHCFYLNFDKFLQFIRHRVNITFHIHQDSVHSLSLILE